MSETISGVLMLAGAAFVFLAAVGILRLPDVFTRMSASAKAVTFGMLCLLAAAVVRFHDLSITTRAFLVILLFFLKSPVASHMLARAAYRTGAPLWKRTIVDEMAQTDAGARRRETMREGDAAAATSGTQSD